MDQGLVTNPKDLERMQHELVSLERRITDLEDTELEVMERLEEAQGELDAADRPSSPAIDAAARRARRQPRRRSRRASTTSSTELAAERVPPRPTGCPADLLALYERLRAQKGGVGAAALRPAQCGGCRLTSTRRTSA